MAHKSDPSKIDASRIPATAKPGSRNQLRKIEGRITDRIYTWLWSKTKRIRLNPMKPWKKKTVMESGQNNNNMRYTFVRLIDMVNLMIAEIAKIPPLEAKIEALEEMVTELQTEFNTHKGNSSAHHVKTPPSTGGAPPPA
jgi:hypothetical protein